MVSLEVKSSFGPTQTSVPMFYFCAIYDKSKGMFTLVSLHCFYMYDVILSSMGGAVCL